MATAELFKFAGILSAALSHHHLVGFEIARWLRGAGAGSSREELPNIEGQKQQLRGAAAKLRLSRFSRV